MNTNLSLLFILISSFLIYILGIVNIIHSYNKYKFSILFVIISFLMYPISPVIFLMTSILENNKIKKDIDKQNEIITKTKFRLSIIIFIIYCLLFPIYIFLLKHTATNQEWYSEIALVCANITIFFTYLLFMISNRLNKI